MIQMYLLKLMVIVVQAVMLWCWYKIIDNFLMQFRKMFVKCNDREDIARSRLIMWLKVFCLLIRWGKVFLFQKPGYQMVRAP